MKALLITSLVLLQAQFCVGQINSLCKFKSGIYYSILDGDTTFHKVSKRFIIGYSVRTNLYYKNKLRWDGDCHFESIHHKNNSLESRFSKGTRYICEIIDVQEEFIIFTYYGEETGSRGTLKYIKWDNRIPKRYLGIKKLTHEQDRKV